MRRARRERGLLKLLGSAFSQVPDKDQAWQDLHRLTEDKDRDVRMYAYYSLGKASVLKAAITNDEDTLKNELEGAIVFFEKSSNKGRCKSS